MSHSDNCEAPTQPGHPRGAVLHIRVMRLEDRPALIDLWVASWRETMPTIDFEARRDWIAAFLAKPAHDTVVAEADGLLGFASVEGRVLHQVAVAPQAKGSLVARALLAAAKAGSPTGLELEVNRDNARAIRFYEREGFIRTGAGTNPNSGLPTLRMNWHAADP